MTDLFEGYIHGHYLWRCDICDRYFFMTTARNQLYCSTVNKKYGVPCSYIAKHPEVTKRKMKKQRKSDSPYYVLWKNRYDSIRKNKSLSKYSANVSAKAKELIDYYFNLANVDFDYAENQYEKDMELSKIYEEAMKDKENKMYQLDYIPIKPANLNDYFVRYKETNYEKYFNEFLYFYEPVLNRNAQLFITKYGLDNNRINDLKQIFSSLLWSELQSYDSYIPLLQLIKYKVLKAWHEYVRTVCGNVHIDNNNLYQNLRKVALLYSQQPNDKPLEDAVTDIANELNISENTVRNCIITSTWFKQNSNLDIHNKDNENYFISSITDIEIDTLSPEEIYLKNEQREKLRTALSKLKPQDLRLIDLVFGICPDCLKSKEKLTILEASLRVGLTAEGAEKRIKKILKRLKEDLE